MSKEKEADDGEHADGAVDDAGGAVEEERDDDDPDHNETTVHQSTVSPNERTPNAHLRQQPARAPRSACR